MSSALQQLQAKRMRITALVRALLEWLTAGSFLLWCLFAAVSLMGSWRLPSSWSGIDPVFLAWFAAAWWGWAALIWSELGHPPARGYPAWVLTGLAVGMLCVGFAFATTLRHPMPTSAMSLGDALAAILVLLLLGVAPALLAVDHLFHAIRRA